MIAVLIALAIMQGVNSRVPTVNSAKPIQPQEATFTRYTAIPVVSYRLNNIPRGGSGYGTGPREIEFPLGGANTQLSFHFLLIPQEFMPEKNTETSRRADIVWSTEPNFKKAKPVPRDEYRSFDLRFSTGPKASKLPARIYYWLTIDGKSEDSGFIQIDGQLSKKEIPMYWLKSVSYRKFHYPQRK